MLIVPHSAVQPAEFTVCLGQPVVYILVYPGIRGSVATKVGELVHCDWQVMYQGWKTITYPKSCSLEGSVPEIETMGLLNSALMTA